MRWALWSFPVIPFGLTIPPLVVRSVRWLGLTWSSGPISLYYHSFVVLVIAAYPHTLVVLSLETSPCPMEFCITGFASDWRTISKLQLPSTGVHNSGQGEEIRPFDTLAPGSIEDDAL